MLRMICFLDRIKKLKQYILTSVYILSFCVYGVLKCIDLEVNNIMINITLQVLDLHHSNSKTIKLRCKKDFLFFIYVN